MLKRGDRRLAIAGKLMGWPSNVLERINKMQEAEREHLRGLVDWVEDYEATENSSAKLSDPLQTKASSGA